MITHLSHLIQFIVFTTKEINHLILASVLMKKKMTMMMMMMAKVQILISP